jgi:hypothetical protein
LYRRWRVASAFRGALTNDRHRRNRQGQWAAHMIAKGNMVAVQELIRTVLGEPH